jgi:hypothetical protein
MKSAGQVKGPEGEVERYTSYPSAPGTGDQLRVALVPLTALVHASNPGASIGGAGNVMHVTAAEEPLMPPAPMAWTL